MNAACLLYGPDLHYLDHLAPLASLLGLPLITTEEEIYEELQRMYPEVEAIYWDYLEVHFSVVKQFDTVFYAFTREHFEQSFAFAQDHFQKKLRTCWCPHGQSDKDNLSALKNEHFVLLYGDKMREEAQNKGVHKPGFILGNYRLSYYEKHRNHFLGLLKKETESLNPENPTYLYAPTWKDYEDSSSFEDAFSYLVDHLPDNINLIIKLHPNAWLQNPFAIERAFYPYEHKKNLLLLKNFPAIYPILELADVYIGDASSIGYDYLWFDKPMFFLSSRKKKPLLECGFTVDKKNYPKIYNYIEENRKNDSQFSSKRRSLYDRAFSQNSLDKNELLKTIESHYG
jgi:teichoic acid glycerol-phosphate primase